MFTSRKKVGAAVLVALLVTTAGCSLFTGRSVADITVFNDLDETATVEIKVVNDTTGEVVIDETKTIEPDGELNYRDPLTSTGEYEITIRDDLGREKQYVGSPGSPSSGLTASIRDDELWVSVGAA